MKMGKEQGSDSPFLRQRRKNTAMAATKSGRGKGHKSHFPQRLRVTPPRNVSLFPSSDFQAVNIINAS